MPSANSGRSIRGIGVPNVATSLPIVRTFNCGNIPIFEEANQFIIGVTRDSVGAALGNCNVFVFTTIKLANLQRQSDYVGTVPPPVPIYVWTGASNGSGNFTAGPFSRNSGPYWMVAWSAGGDVQGITVDTITSA